jgi:NADH kinase
MMHFTFARASGPKAWVTQPCRRFSISCCRREIRDIAGLPPRLHPQYQGVRSQIFWRLIPVSDNDLYDLLESRGSDLLTLQWPSPPRNILIVKKLSAPAVTGSLIDFIKYENFRV